MMNVRRGQEARRHSRWRLQATARRRVVWRQLETVQLPPLDPAQRGGSHTREETR